MKKALNSQQTLLLKASRHLQAAETFVCPECKQPVFLRRCTLKAAHFAHYSECKAIKVGREDFDPRHREIQLEIIDAINDYCSIFDIEAEASFEVKFAKNRADILFVDLATQKRTVYEVQRSAISKDGAEERIRSYRTYGIELVWIFADLPAGPPPSWVCNIADLYGGNIYLYEGDGSLVRPARVVQKPSGPSLLRAKDVVSLVNHSFEPAKLFDSLLPEHARTHYTSLPRLEKLKQNWMKFAVPVSKRSSSALDRIEFLLRKIKQHFPNAIGSTGYKALTSNFRLDLENDEQWTEGSLRIEKFLEIYPKSASCILSALIVARQTLLQIAESLPSTLLAYDIHLAPAKRERGNSLLIGFVICLEHGKTIKILPKEYYCLGFNNDKLRRSSLST
jgi:hypothetical protein